ncbi:MAG: site-2 protease family protein [Puniceicoccales bacterium]|nr:site-2 protease family protein [Puniceicoccales bacterium]
MVIFFGGSIFVHELGHYLAAKSRKFYIPRFSIGFGPKLFSWKHGETEFRISLLPFGGYVALPQLAEMKEIEGEFDIPKGFKKPSCMDKIIAASMGVIFNMIFAFVLASIIWVVGCEKPGSSMTNVIGYVHEKIWIKDDLKVKGPAYKAGLLPGDKVLSIDGKQVRTHFDLMNYIVLGTNRSLDDKPLARLQVERNGSVFDVDVYPELVMKNEAAGDYMRTIGVEMAQKLIVHEVFKNSPGEKAGLQNGDILLKIDDQDIFSLSQLNHILQSTNKPHSLLVQSGNESKSLRLDPMTIPVKKPYVKLQFDDCFMEIYPDYAEGTKLSNLFDDKVICKLLEYKHLSNTYRDITPGSRLMAVNSKEIETMADLVFILKNTKSPQLRFMTKKGLVREVSYGNIKNLELVQPERVNSIGVLFSEGTRMVHCNPVSQLLDSVRNTLITLNSLISRKSNVALKNLMGLPGIVKTLNMFALCDFRLFLLFIITLNVNLAVLNILPIPFLDGGHIMMAVAEKIMGKNLSGRLTTAVQFLFMVLLMLLMVYVSFFDIRRIFGDHDNDVKAEKLLNLQVPVQALWEGMASANE